MKVDIEVIDRRVKWWLLGVSLATLALAIVAALSENVFPGWRVTRMQYAEILQEKATDARGRLVADQFKIDPDQYVLPEARRTDRCITCHAGMEDPRLSDQAHPFRSHPGDLLATHPPKKYGCTICHQGQGPATALPDAHGDVPFWSEPMIPARYAYAGCGTCHTYLGVPTVAALARGRNLVEQHDCLSCHRIDGRGGTIRPGSAGGMEGPDLSHAGVRGFDPRWYENHLQRREQADSGPWKTSFGPIDSPDRGGIEGFLVTRVGAPDLIEGKALFHSLGCQGCHKVGGIGGEDGPDLTIVGKKDPHRVDFTHVSGEHTLANRMREHLRWPAKVMPGSQMPAMGLSDPQIDRLVLYLLSLRRSELPQAYWPKDRVRSERLGEREFSTDGATLYGTFCAACHGPAGEGRRYPGLPMFPAAGNPDFLAAASDQFLSETIERGRTGRRMPAWGGTAGGLRPEETRQIVAHLRQIGGVKEARKPDPKRRWIKGDAEAGGRRYADYCAGCHGKQGEGLEAPALNNKQLLTSADDTYLMETIGRGRRGTPMKSFREGSTVNPALSAAEIESIVAYLRRWEGANR